MQMGLFFFPSLVATFDVIKQYEENKSTAIFRPFFQSLKKHYKISFLMGIGILIISLLLTNSITVFLQQFQNGLINVIGFFLTVSVILVLLFCLVHLPLVLVYFRGLRLIDYGKLSLIWAFRDFVLTLMMVVIVVFVLVTDFVFLTFWPFLDKFTNLFIGLNDFQMYAYIPKNIKEFEMYKKYLTLLLLLLSLSFISLKGTSLPIFAFEEVNTPSPYVKRIVPMETKSLPGGVELRSQGVRTQNNGDPQGSWLDRDVHSLVAPGSNTAVRVVSWGLSAANGFSAGTMVEIAQDYQIKHPGTIVIGGISGDFFNNQTPDGNTKEPLNNWVSEGDVIKKDVLEPDFHNVLGFKEDRSWVEGKPTSTENLQLKILNEGDVTDVYDIANIIGTSGDTLNPNGINIVYPGFDGNLDTTGYTIVKGNYETFKQSRTGLQGKIYIENDNLGSFLKGEIKEIIPGGEAISKVPLGTFYILSKDESIQTISG